MPIRMTDDDPSDSQEEESPRPSGGGWNGGGGGGGGNGGGIFALIQLITFVFRHPILALIIAVACGGFYLVSNHTSVGGGSSSANSSGNRPHAPTVPGGDGSLDKRGATLDPKAYDQTLVHEPLEASALPTRVSLAEFAPPRGNQGHQGSCVGWSTSYAARSILYTRQTGTQLTQQTAFSPAFVYDQLAHGRCSGGSVISHALQLMKDEGDLPLSEFAYDQKRCDRLPDGNEKNEARQYRIAGFDRLSQDASDYSLNALAIKQHLAQGAPVVIGMHVGGTFETAMEGARVWHPTQDDWDERGDWGGHAMAVIGYDDMLEGGAFLLMNSWGNGWGEQGLGYVRYKDFNHFVKEAYGLYPMGSSTSGDQSQLLHFGLVETGTQKRIPMQAVSANVFRTERPIRKGTRFKVEFSNTQPVYTYLFGQETDGSSYVLFPYTDKHNPYCGTVGTRVFPRKQSLTADNLGTRDSVAVVISPKALDFKKLNEEINAAQGSSYGDKVSAALGARQSHAGQLAARNGTVELDSSGDGDKVNLVVLEFDKK